MSVLVRLTVDPHKACHMDLAVVAFPPVDTQHVEIFKVNAFSLAGIPELGCKPEHAQAVQLHVAGFTSFDRKPGRREFLKPPLSPGAGKSRETHVETALGIFSDREELAFPEGIKHIVCLPFLIDGLLHAELSHSLAPHLAGKGLPYALEGLTGISALTAFLRYPGAAAPSEGKASQGERSITRKLQRTLADGPCAFP